MAYKIQYYRQALLDAARLKRDEPKAYEKLKKLEKELMEHPKTGTGKPEATRWQSGWTVESSHNQET